MTCLEKDNIICYIYNRKKEMNVEKILKCCECGTIFEYDELISKRVRGCYESDYGVLDQFDNHNYYDEEVECCPSCGSENFKEGYICTECGEFVPWLDDEKYGVCFDCTGKYTEEEYLEKYPKE